MLEAYDHGKREEQILAEYIGLVGDPRERVSHLWYRLLGPQDQRLHRPRRVHEGPEAIFVLRDADLFVVLKSFVESHIDAYAQVTPILKAWEIELGLANDFPIRIQYKGFTRVKNGKRSGSGGGGVVNVPTEPKKITVPNPPLPSHHVQLAHNLWTRYSSYLSGSEPLPGVAFAMLRMLLSETKGQDSLAAKRFGIEAEVLQRIRKLSSERGDIRTAGKPLTPRVRPFARGEAERLKADLVTLVRQLAGSNPSRSSQ